MDNTSLSSAGGCAGTLFSSDENAELQGRLQFFFVERYQITRIGTEDTG